MALKLKTTTVDGKEYAEIKDGKPVYVDETSSNEIAFDANQSTAKIAELNAESKRHREKAEAEAAKAKEFEGLDPTKVREALQTVENLDTGQLQTAAKVQEIKDAAVAATKAGFEKQLETLKTSVTELTAANQKTSSELHNEKISNAFATSPYIKEKMTIAPVMAQKVFGEYFKVEDGKVVAYKDGAKIFSQENPGGEPKFDEAISIIVGGYEYKDSVLKGRGHSGSGGGGPEGGGPQNGGGNTMFRADFEKINPVAQGKFLREGGTVVDRAAN